MKEIKLSQGLSAKVSDEDFEELNKYKWAAKKDFRTFYAIRKDENRKTVYMQHVIIGEYDKKKYKLDHEDRDGLNNQRYNLRLVDNSTNAANSRLQKRREKVGYKGVYKKLNRFQVLIRKDEKLHYIGSFLSKEEAYKVYLEERLKLRGVEAQV